MIQQNHLPSDWSNFYITEYPLLLECNPSIIVEFNYQESYFKKELKKCSYGCTPDEALVNVLAYAFDGAVRSDLISSSKKDVPFVALCESGIERRTHCHAIVFDNGSYDQKNLITYLNKFLWTKLLNLNYQELMEYKKRLNQSKDAQKAYAYDKTMEVKGSKLKYICKIEKHQTDPLFYLSKGLKKMIRKNNEAENG